MTRTAIPQYCSRCGRELGSVRTIIAGVENIQLHQHCVDAWREANRYHGTPTAVPNFTPVSFRFTVSSTHLAKTV